MFFYFSIANFLFLFFFIYKLDSFLLKFQEMHIIKRGKKSIKQVAGPASDAWF